MTKYHSAPRTPGMLLFGLAMVLAAAAALLLAFAGNGPAAGRNALANIDPANCDPAIGSGAGAIRIDGAPVTVTDGAVLNYKVGAAYPAIPAQSPGCTAFNIDVFIDPPGPVGFTFVCNLDVAVPLPGGLVSGSPTIECPNSYMYTANGAHRTGSLLVASVVAIGDKHDQPDDCIVPSPRNPAVIPDPNCFSGGGTSNISMPSTPTATSTPTNTPTSTPTNPPTATDTPTVTSTPQTPTNTPRATNTPRHERNTPQPTNTRRPNTSTPLPAQVTRTSVVLASTPTRAPVGITLPPAGNGGGGMSTGMTMLVAALAAGAAISAGAGVAVSRRRV